MSLDELRERNRQKVIEVALNCFVEQGIFKTKISTIAKASGLTERSVYRYFETKADLVLEAALLFWDNNVRKAEEVYLSPAVAALSGAMQIRLVLLSYGNLYFTDRKKLIFIHEAEIYLYHEQKNVHIGRRPPAPYKSFSAPLAKAIRRGIEDGSVKKDIDHEGLYYSAYDSLLGLIQKLALVSEYAGITTERARARLSDFCDMLTASFAKID